MKNLRVLGLSIVAILAMTAVSASAASAAEFTASSYPVTVSGGQTTQHVFTAGGGTVECEEASFSGSASEAAPTLSITPTYAGCEAFGFIGATVSMNGCTYLFHANELTNGEVDVVCSGSNKIVINAGPCKSEIGPQTGLTNVEFTNESGNVLTQAEVGGITAKVIKNNFLCPLKAQTVTNATYTGDTLVEGSSAIDVG